MIHFGFGHFYPNRNDDMPTFSDESDEEKDIEI